MGRDGTMGVHLDVPINGFAGRLEVIEGPTGRRQRTDAEKARIVAESLMPGMRVADVARKYGATRWQIYDWRKRLRREQRRLTLPESILAAPAFAAGHLGFPFFIPAFPSMPLDFYSNNRGKFG
jgi:transposase